MAPAPEALVTTAASGPASTPAESLFDQLPPPPAKPVVVVELAAPGVGDRDAMIERIMQMSRRATRYWLERFSDGALHEYLMHLQAAATPRGRAATWVRTTKSPAITFADAPE